VRDADPVNILIVDDHPENLVALEALLAEPGYHLIKAGSGREALGHLLQHEFAVILLDAQMPVMDGFELASLIRSRESSRKVPIIFVTAFDTEQRYIYQGYDAGAVDYLTKPIDTHILRSKVAVFVELFRNERKEQRARMERLELESLRRYRNLADAIPHMVWKSHPDGTLNYCNQVWMDYTRLRPGSSAWGELVHPEDLKGFLDAWSSARGPEPREFEHVARLRKSGDGFYRWHLLKVVPELEDDRLTAWLGTNTDIHDRKQAEEALNQKANELARSNEELEQFAYVASHDLQEPLRMMASYAQLLERRYKGRLDESGDKFIGYVVDGATRMQALINDLLTYSRAGKGKLELDRCEIEQVLAKVLETDLKDSISQSGARITHDPLPVLRANSVKIGQLLQNLIANAIKFARDEPPRIHVSARLEGREWVFSVSDNGIGIDPQYYRRIFVIFQRLHTRQQYPGTGMGLAICKKIVERHQGRIWVESKPGKGSTFHFTIPDASGRLKLVPQEPKRSDAYARTGS
jgi:PAS domain S-box-containing protein